MEAYEVRAYEICGLWTIVVIRVWTDEDGRVQRDLVYRGDHHAIDEMDPYIRVVLLLSRVVEDVSDFLSQMGESEVFPAPRLVN